VLAQLLLNVFLLLLDAQVPLRIRHQHADGLVAARPSKRVLDLAILVVEVLFDQRLLVLEDS